MADLRTRADRRMKWDAGGLRNPCFRFLDSIGESTAGRNWRRDRGKWHKLLISVYGEVPSDVTIVHVHRHAVRHASHVVTWGSAWQHPGMVIVKCIGCGRLSDWAQRCVHCGGDRVEPLVMQEESDDQPIRAASDSRVALNALWVSDSFK